MFSCSTWTTLNYDPLNPDGASPMVVPVFPLFPSPDKALALQRSCCTLECLSSAHHLPVEQEKTLRLCSQLNGQGVVQAPPLHNRQLPRTACRLSSLCRFGKFRQEHPLCAALRFFDPLALPLRLRFPCVWRKKNAIDAPMVRPNHRTSTLALLVAPCDPRNPATLMLAPTTPGVCRQPDSRYPPTYHPLMSPTSFVVLCRWRHPSCACTMN